MKTSNTHAWLFLLACLFIAPIIHAKEDKPPYVWEKISSVELTQKEIITYVNAYIAEKFVSGKHVIELSDPELGKLVGTVTLMDPDAKMLSAFHGINGRLIVDAKDGRYRLQMTTIVAVDSKLQKSDWGQIEGANNYRIQPVSDRTLANFANELQTYLANAKKASDW